ncbi:MAG: alpha/beta hydrolase [Bacteroidota bacterium]
MKKLKKTFLIIGIFLLLAGGSFVYFLYSRKAPITQGKVEYQLMYKEGLALDLYEPTQELYELRPLLIHFHGGAWIGGAKEAINNDRFHGAINSLREKGYVVISPNYTLAESGKSPFPKCVEDALDVMKWVGEHAKEYKLDLKNVGLMGESAGAHLALMAAYSKGEDFGISYSYPINYVVDVYGPVDLKALYTGSEIRKELEARIQNFPPPIKKGLNISQYLFGFDPQTDTTKAWSFAEKHSPIAYLGADAPPLLMIHGDIDRVVPYEQSVLLKAKADSIGIVNEIHKLKGSDHAFMGATEAQKDSVQKWIGEFVEKYSQLN